MSGKAITGVCLDAPSDEIFGNSVVREVTQSKKALHDFYKFYPSVTKEVFDNYSNKLNNVTHKGEASSIMTKFRKEFLK